MKVGVVVVRGDGVAREIESGGGGHGEWCCMAGDGGGGGSYVGYLDATQTRLILFVGYTHSF